jgi:hypothetical protein
MLAERNAVIRKAVNEGSHHYGLMELSAFNLINALRAEVDEGDETASELIDTIEKWFADHGLKPQDPDHEME